MKEKIKKFISFILNPRLILCFGIGWMITNGWSSIALGLGSFYDIEWLVAVATAYLAFLWVPMTPEKIVTFIIAIWLLRLLFPKDEKTLKILKDMRERVWQKYLKYKEKVLRRRNARKERKNKDSE